MASTYSSLKIQLMATGENLGTWGNVTNINLGTAIEEAIVGSADITFSSADVTLTLSDSNSTQPARNLRLNLIGFVGAPQNLILGSGCQIDKVYIVNNTLAQTITVKNTTGTGIAVPAGKTMYVYNDGTNVVNAITHLTSLTLGSALPVASGGTGATTLNGLTFTGENITNLNASNIALGTLANARTTASASNGASTIVARDASGNFSANTITASLTGTAANATVLQTARTIALQDGVTGTATSFDGSTNISIPVTAINASVINIGTLANARTTGSSANGANTLVLRDATGSFSTNLISANGSLLTALNASSITSGTLANDRTTASSSNSAFTIVSRDTNGDFTSRNVSATNFIGTLNGSGANVTSINASNISSGTLDPARLGTTANVQFGSVGVGTAASGTTGEIRATNNITAYFSSDKRFKENVRDVDDALSKVCTIGVKMFDWTDAYIKAHGGEDGYFLQKASFGVIAQDVYSVFPEAVRTREDGSLAVDYEKLAVLSFGAIKELVKRIELLESK
jgi:hypothetical protein